VEWLTNKARSFVFSTAPPPAQAAVGAAAVRWMGTEAATQRRHLLWSNIHHFHLCANLSHQLQSAIVPLIVGENEAALSASKALQTASSAGELGFWVPAIRYPTVPKGSARLRVTLSAAHSQNAIESLVYALQRMSLNQST